MKGYTYVLKRLERDSEPEIAALAAETLRGFEAWLEIMVRVECADPGSESESSSSSSESSEEEPASELLKKTFCPACRRTHRE